MPQTIRRLFVVFCSLSAYMMLGCNDIATSNRIEFVMCEGMRIEVNARRDITITALSKTERKYETNDTHVTVGLTPRRERWYGSMGLYRPTGDSRLHMVLEEGQQHFYSESEAMDWVMQLKAESGIYVVYTSDGLVVGWKKSSVALQVQVWQVYVQGTKPQALPGANDSEVSVFMPANRTRNCADAGIFKPSPPAVIGDRVFSGHALDLMHEKGVSPEDVNKIIATGSPWKSGEYVEYLNRQAFQNVSVVILDKDGKVVSII